MDVTPISTAWAIRLKTSFHLLSKPTGPLCNLDCSYCFYLKKEELYPGRKSKTRWQMSPEVLEAYVRQYLESQDTPEVEFTWQGGEPTLLGIDFFARAVSLQKRYANGKRISNSLQTNGVLLDHRWGEFLAQNHFLVGLSIDGPEELHDRYRLNKGGKPTFRAVLRGLDILKKHGVEFNTLTVVNRDNGDHPLRVYEFLKQIGSRFHQYIPAVEQDQSTMVPWSVGAEQYGEFLCTIFDRWVCHDVARVFVQLFDVSLQSWLRVPQSLCFFRETCGRAVALEHNGDLYSCDHFVTPEDRLGNILSQSLETMVDSPQQARFGLNKKMQLPGQCQRCSVRFACNGGCPKNRFLTTQDGEPGLNYLCAGYLRFFRHIDPMMRAMADLLRRGLAPAQIMPLARRQLGLSSATEQL